MSMSSQTDLGTDPKTCGEIVKVIRVKAFDLFYKSEIKP